MVGKNDWRYLGPASWPQWLLRLAPFSRRFNAAAKGHDMGYGIGGCLDRKAHVDEQFMIGMLSVCGWNLAAYLAALIYYMLVFTVGIFFFNWRPCNAS